MSWGVLSCSNNSSDKILIGPNCWFIVSKYLISYLLTKILFFYLSFNPGFVFRRWILWIILKRVSSRTFLENCSGNLYPVLSFQTGCCCISRIYWDDFGHTRQCFVWVSVGLLGSRDSSESHLTPTLPLDALPKSHYNLYNSPKILTQLTLFKSNSKWWPFFVVLFYILVPVPTAFAKRHLNSMGDGTGGQELALFLTLSLLISSFALPIVLCHASVVSEDFFLKTTSIHSFLPIIYSRSLGKVAY